MPVRFLLAAALFGVPYASAQPVRFPSSNNCAMCHGRLSPPENAAWKEGPSIAPYALWRDSMMAKAATDPYFLARVRYESQRAGTAVDAKCLGCHAPAGSTEESVTCSVCHQISDRNLGARASFSGNFALSGENRAFGPHLKPFTMPMEHHTGLTPTHASHILSAALCATCHTVITHPQGTPEGTEFVEQAPYFEWISSAWAEEGVACQSCHVERLATAAGEDAASYIAHRPPGGPFPPTKPRTPFGLHLFVGANYQVPPLLGAEVTARRAAANLTRALSLSAHGSASKGTTVVDVTVVNLTGHKLPTAYPSRRLWLHVRAFDARGSVIFESGAWDPNRGELLAGAEFRPHLAVVDSPGQVQVYEAEYLDAQRRPTLSLIEAAAYRKDNRILPRGFDPRRSEFGARVMPSGTGGDKGFKPGSHVTKYVIQGAAARVEVQACYQSIKPSHLAETGAIKGLRLEPVIAARTEITLDGVAAR